MEKEPTTPANSPLNINFQGSGSTKTPLKQCQSGNKYTPQSQIIQKLTERIEKMKLNDSNFHIEQQIGAELEEIQSEVSSAVTNTSQTFSTISLEMNTSNSATESLSNNTAAENDSSQIETNSRAGILYTSQTFNEMDTSSAAAEENILINADAIEVLCESNQQEVDAEEIQADVINTVVSNPQSSETMYLEMIASNSFPENMDNTSIIEKTESSQQMEVDAENIQDELTNISVSLNISNTINQNVENYADSKEVVRETLEEILTNVFHIAENKLQAIYQSESILPRPDVNNIQMEQISEGAAAAEDIQKPQQFSEVEYFQIMEQIAEITDIHILEKMVEAQSGQTLEVTPKIEDVVKLDLIPESESQTIVEEIREVDIEVITEPNESIQTQAAEDIVKLDLIPEVECIPTPGVATVEILSAEDLQTPEPTLVEEIHEVADIEMMPEPKESIQTTKTAEEIVKLDLIPEVECIPTPEVATVEILSAEDLQTPEPTLVEEIHEVADIEMMPEPKESIQTTKTAEEIVKLDLIPEVEGIPKPEVTIGETLSEVSVAEVLQTLEPTLVEEIREVDDIEMITELNESIQTTKETPTSEDIVKIDLIPEVEGIPKHEAVTVETLPEVSAAKKLKTPEPALEEICEVEDIEMIVDPNETTKAAEEIVKLHLIPEVEGIPTPKVATLETLSEVFVAEVLQTLEPISVEVTAIQDITTEGNVTLDLISEVENIQTPEVVIVDTLSEISAAKKVQKLEPIPEAGNIETSAEDDNNVSASLNGVPDIVQETLPLVEQPVLEDAGHPKVESDKLGSLVNDPDSKNSKDASELDSEMFNENKENNDPENKITTPGTENGEPSKKTPNRLVSHIIRRDRKSFYELSPTPLAERSFNLNDETLHLKINELQQKNAKLKIFVCELESHIIRKDMEIQKLNTALKTSPPIEETSEPLLEKRMASIKYLLEQSIKEKDALEKELIEQKMKNENLEAALKRTKQKLRTSENNEMALKYIKEKADEERKKYESEVKKTEELNKDNQMLKNEYLQLHMLSSKMRQHLIEYKQQEVDVAKKLAEDQEKLQSIASTFQQFKAHAKDQIDKANKEIRKLQQLLAEKEKMPPPPARKMSTLPSARTFLRKK